MEFNESEIYPGNCHAGRVGENEKQGIQTHSIHRRPALLIPFIKILILFCWSDIDENGSGCILSGDALCHVDE